MSPADRKKRARGQPARSRWNWPWLRSLIHGAAVIVLTLHAAAFGAAALLLPRGFAAGDIHAWSDTWLPAAAAIGIGGVVLHFVFLRSSPLALSLIAAAIGGGWLAAAVSGRVLFPQSIGVERAIGPAAVAVALSTLAWATRMNGGLSVASALLGGGLGIGEVIAQRAEPPSTRPSGGTLAEVNGEPTKDEAASGQLAFACGKDHVRIRPLLTFESRSPDATWTILAPPEAMGPRRHFDAFAREKSGFRAHYIDDGVTTLVATRDAKGLDIEAISTLPHPVYSHLNAFTTIHVPFEAELSFSATGSQRFPIEDREERPAPLAYLGPDLALHVVSAESASGPYGEIATGHLGRGEPIALEIRRKDGAGACRLTFKDWSAELSTEPSPTAGWGLPQNAIQFSARGKDAVIVLTLAESGPGRGWRSVGHAAGSYENRIRVDTLAGASPK